MPELPEVETTRRGIAPHLLGHRVQALHVRQPRLRWPVPAELATGLGGQTITSVERRGKYLLLGCARGTAILHLGMSGSLRVLPADEPPGRHDHLDIVLDDGRCLRLRDPRRFGAALWTAEPPETHPLLASLGPEPLAAAFDGEHLHACAAGRRVSVKELVMNAHVVVGVGNIYANEALFAAGIHPRRAAGRISLARYRRLAAAIKQILAAAIEQGGTTLRDFSRADGSPGYFALSLKVYGREGEACQSCGQPIRQRRIGQRSSFFCPHCQH